MAEEIDRQKRAVDEMIVVDLLTGLPNRRKLRLHRVLRCGLHDRAVRARRSPLRQAKTTGRNRVHAGA